MTLLTLQSLYVGVLRLLVDLISAALAVVAFRTVVRELLQLLLLPLPS